jgi:hypothetical protein
VLQIAGGIILAVLFFAFLPYIIAGVVLIASSALVLAALATVLGVAWYFLDKVGIDWALTGLLLSRVLVAAFFLWLALVFAAAILSILGSIGLFSCFPRLNALVIKFIAAMEVESLTKAISERNDKTLH